MFGWNIVYRDLDDRVSVEHDTLYIDIWMFWTHAFLLMKLWRKLFTYSDIVHAKYECVKATLSSVGRGSVRRRLRECKFWLQCFWDTFIRISIKLYVRPFERAINHGVKRIVWRDIAIWIWKLTLFCRNLHLFATVSHNVLIFTHVSQHSFVVLWTHFVNHVWLFCETSCSRRDIGLCLSRMPPCTCNCVSFDSIQVITWDFEGIVFFIYTFTMFKMGLWKDCSRQLDDGQYPQADTYRVRVVKHFRPPKLVCRLM
jgi:hypothetical protein